MFFSVQYTPKAWMDFREYHQQIYLRSCEMEIADRWQETLMTHVASLREYPLRFPEFEVQPYRKMTIGNYSVIYRIDDEVVTICRIVYATMLPDNYGTIE